MPRLPEYLKRPIIDTEKTKIVRRILKTKCLNTVCEGARCPNKAECYSHNTATFLIMGNVCTRNCRYCNISPARPEPLDLEEPRHIAEAVKELGLKFAVITSVTRDDLPDGGAEHFKNCIDEIRKVCDAKIEILTPDFQYRPHPLTPSLKGRGDETAVSEDDYVRSTSLKGRGDETAVSEDDYVRSTSLKGRGGNPLDTIISAHPDVFNHNIETVRSVFKTARPQGDYGRSLEVLRYIKENSDIVTKSGLMVGLGEEIYNITPSVPSPSREGISVEETLLDLKAVGVDIVTIGQYIQPSKQHLEVSKYYTLEEFEELKELARKIGFKNFQIGPLVRSSYHAKQCFNGSCAS